MVRAKRTVKQYEINASQKEKLIEALKLFGFQCERFGYDHHILISREKERIIIGKLIEMKWHKIRGRYLLEIYSDNCTEEEFAHVTMVLSLARINNSRDSS